MSGVRRRGYFAAAVAILGAALVTALMAAPPDRPVDIRLVAPPPLSPQTVTATAATTMSAVGPVVPTTTVPPKAAPVASALPRPVAPSTSSSSPPPSSSRPRGLLDLLRCDYRYFEDDFQRCLPWPLTPKELCEFMDDHHLRPIEVRGPDGRDLDHLDCH